MIDLGSGCGSVGIAVASNSRGLRFKSSDLKILLWTCTVNCIEKAKIKVKRVFLKNTSLIDFLIQLCSRKQFSLQSSVTILLNLTKFSTHPIVLSSQNFYCGFYDLCYLLLFRKTFWTFISYTYLPWLCLIPSMPLKIFQYSILKYYRPHQSLKLPKFSLFPTYERISSSRKWRIHGRYLNRRSFLMDAIPLPTTPLPMPRTATTYNKLV